MVAGFSIIFLYFIGLVSGQLTKTTMENYDYCDPRLKLCSVPSEHVMCKYPVPGLSEKCTPAVYEPLSAMEKKKILFLHNKFRSNIAVKKERNVNKELPASSNMRQLYWDKELELLAERWAQQCVSFTTPKVYDKCRNIRRFEVSQNVGTRRVNGTTIDKQAPQIVVIWIKESKDFLPTYVDKFPTFGEDKVTVKQFANMIWADTFSIGCARAVFQENFPSTDKGIKKTTTWTVERLICNYGPSGKMMGKSVYKRGAPCENCPEGTECSKAFPGLCAIQNAEMLEGQQNIENQENKETNQETTPQISVQETSKIEKPEDDDQDQKMFHLDDDMEDDEEEVTTEHTIGISDLTRINEILKNPKVSTEHRKTALIDSIDFKAEKYRKEKKTAKRDVAIQKTAQRGGTCVCYVPVEGEHSSASRMGVYLLFFYAATISRLVC